MVTFGKAVKRYVESFGATVDKSNPTIGDCIRALGEFNGVDTTGTPAEIIEEIEGDGARNVTLGESVKKYTESRDVVTGKHNPTIGESIRAFGETMGVDTSGTPAQIIEALANVAEGGSGSSGDPVSDDREVALTYLNSFDSSTTLASIERSLELYPASNPSYPTMLDNTYDSVASTATLVLSVTDWEISSGITVTGQLSFIFNGTMSNWLDVTSYRIYSSSLTFSGGTRTITVTDVDVSGSIANTLLLTIDEEAIDIIQEYSSDSLGEITSGSYKVNDTEYTIGA